MKKILTIFGILAVSLLCTACINNFAIQELNQIGKKYLESNDYENAVARFKSSVDLDDTIFESQYNLGVALIRLHNYKEAIPVLEKAISLNDKSPDAHYSYAVALEGEGLRFEREESTEDSNSEEEQTYQNYSASDVEEGLKLAGKAIGEFTKYLELSKSADKANIENHVQGVKDSIIKIARQYSLNPLDFSVTNDDINRYDANNPSFGDNYGEDSEYQGQEEFNSDSAEGANE